jgi:hypothetical protein
LNRQAAALSHDAREITNRIRVALWSGLCDLSVRFAKLGTGKTAARFLIE